MRLRAPFAAAALAIISAAFVFADSQTSAAFTPYPAPDFSINMPDGKPLHLSSLKGKVVVVECLFTTCPHCQHASQVFTQLHKEFGSRGFQPVGVAFNDELFGPNITPANLVTDFVKQFNVGYPVGWSDRAKVLEFLGATPFDRLVVPQMVWIDRKGMVRAKTRPDGTDTDHYNEAFWRQMIETLTKEPAGAAGKSATHRPLHTAQK
jgi:peroxiredoxin